MVNEFKLFEILCVLQTIASKYPESEEAEKQIVRLKELVSERKYRLAVVGEFKRGKSSMINALVGAKLLPTDILPATAVVNRLVYGEKSRIFVHYKDKDKPAEEKTIQELKDYATKLGSRSEEQAAEIREVVVEYPSVFCQNHIEIIDTPGLNDNSYMEAATLDILGEIDFAIVTVNATLPVSMTEMELILTLLAENGIYHIIFVATFIDRVSAKKEEQDKMISFIKERITSEVLPMARERFKEQPEILRKSEEILAAPRIFAVSSSLAMKGFVYGDEEMLEQSRFPQFKQELFELLTADQSADMYQKTVDYLENLDKKLDKWYKNYVEKNVKAAKEQYGKMIGRWIQDGLLKMERELEQKGILSGDHLCNDFCHSLEQAMAGCYIKALGSLRSENLEEKVIRECLQNASGEALQAADHARKILAQSVWERTKRVTDVFSDLREKYGYDKEEWEAKLKKWNEDYCFPEFRWVDATIQEDRNTLLNGEVILLEKKRIAQILREYDKRVGEYMTSWRKLIFQQISMDFRDITGVATEDEREISEILQQLQDYKEKYGESKRKVQECRWMLGAMKQEE